MALITVNEKIADNTTRMLQDAQTVQASYSPWIQDLFEESDLDAIEGRAELISSLEDKFPVAAKAAQVSERIVPVIVSVENVSRARKGQKHRTHGTDVTFDNGVVLKFTGRHGEQAAREIAWKMYANYVAAGFTDQEMIKHFRVKAQGTKAA